MFFRRSHIVIFFCLSVVTAYMVHLWNKSSPSGFVEFASYTPQVLSEKVQRIINTSDNVTEELRSYGSKMTETEDPQNCAIDRNYFERAFQETAPIYREERTKSPNEFPRVCMTYVMRSSFAEAETKLSPSFAICANGSFKKGAFKPCVTDQYVNIIYNYFGDITECLGIPQRDMLPQFYYDSGMHINVLGRHGEMGLAQLSKVSIADAANYVDEYIQEISSSNKSSCQRLKPYLKSLKLNASDKSQVCRMTAAPDSPLYNLFYFAIKYKHDQTLIQKLMQRPEYNILSRMQKLGLSEEQVDQEQLLQMLTALSSHAGAKTAVKMLSQYLQAAEVEGRQLSLKDFDFSEATGFSDYLNKYQDSGFKGYLNFLQQAARELNAVFKEGVCAPDSYLKL